MITQTALHKLNNLLSYVVLMLAFYILFTPAFPEVQYDITKAVHAQIPAKEIAQSSQVIPKENRLIIPAIGVDAEILEGESSSLLDKGIWHRPHSSSPDMGSNTVLVGHRYMYTSGPTTFYLLPKLKQADEIDVYWNSKKYTYTVTDIRIVPPTEVSIESPTIQAQLTLYTCTPLWNPISRYVVIAKPL